MKNYIERKRMDKKGKKKINSSKTVDHYFLMLCCYSITYGIRYTVSGIMTQYPVK